MSNQHFTDFNKYIRNGEYHIINVQSMANKPPTKHNMGTLSVTRSDGSGTKTQYFYTFNGTYIRHRKKGLDSWGPWKHLPINETIPIPLKSGYGGQAILGKTGCNVTLVGNISGGAQATLLGKLEEGYRPIIDSTNSMIESPPGQPSKSIEVDIKIDGSIIAKTAPAPGATISLNGASFIAK